MQHWTRRCISLTIRKNSACQSENWHYLLNACTVKNELMKEIQQLIYKLQRTVELVESCTACRSCCQFYDQCNCLTSSHASYKKKWWRNVKRERRRAHKIMFDFLKFPTFLSALVCASRAWWFIISDVNMNIWALHVPRQTIRQVGTVVFFLLYEECRGRNWPNYAAYIYRNPNISPLENSLQHLQTSDSSERDIKYRSILLPTNMTN